MRDFYKIDNAKIIFALFGFTYVEYIGASRSRHNQKRSRLAFFLVSILELLVQLKVASYQMTAGDTSIVS